MDIIIKMTDGRHVAEVYRQNHCRRRGKSACGLRVYNENVGLYYTACETQLPEADVEGLEFEFHRVVDKAQRAGYRILEEPGVE